MISVLQHCAFSKLVFLPERLVWCMTKMWASQMLGACRVLQQSLVISSGTMLPGPP